MPLLQLINRHRGARVADCGSVDGDTAAVRSGMARLGCLPRAYLWPFGHRSIQFRPVGFSLWRHLA
jgi:hypothetical protein